MEPTQGNIKPSQVRHIANKANAQPILAQCCAITVPQRCNARPTQGQHIANTERTLGHYRANMRPLQSCDEQLQSNTRIIQGTQEQGAKTGPTKAATDQYRLKITAQGQDNANTEPTSSQHHTDATQGQHMQTQANMHCDAE